MSDPIDYESVLQDLRARREKLDLAIAAIEQMLGGLAGAAEMGSRPSSLPRDVSDDTFLGMNIPAAARKFLQMMKRPQTTADIAAALRRGGVHSEAKDFTTTVYTALDRQKDMIRVGKKWSMREWHPNLRNRARADGESPSEPEPQESPAE